MLRNMESEICIPLISKGKLIGIINLGMKGNKRMYSHEDIEMLSTLANNATIAIENAQLVENINKTRKRMIRVDRLASIGQLAAGIAHEIRNPLVAIKTSAQLLPERYNDEEFRTYFSTIVASEIERATKKITDLLDYARPSAPFFQQENINEIIESMVAFVKNDAYKKEQTIETHLSRDLPTITLDKQQMKQVFINLLFNAIQSTPAKGRISITTKKRSKSNGSADFIQVEVSDTGVGISEEDLDKIFIPFFTTKAKEEGSGLGLAMTHQIIEEHEGTIDVQSEVNQGTTFTINLPVNPLVFKQNKADAQNLH
jgi:signal transduction histidine kinase